MKPKATYTPGKPVTPPPGTVTLTMTEEQAKTLRAVCYLIGGSPTKSRRGDMDEIGNALSAALPFFDLSKLIDENVDKGTKHTAAIYFKNRGAV